MPSARIVLSLLTVLSLAFSNVAAQTLASRINKPPAGVEEALRDRVTKFFQLQSEGKFRQGESYVCDESKDAYYDAFKNKWTSVKIVSITWEDSFQTGKVLMSLGTELKTLGGSIPAQYPLTTVWKVQNNNWCYFVPPVDTTLVPSPFGAMKPGPTSADGGLATNRKAPPTSSDIARMVGITKSELHVKADEQSTDSLEVINGLPGSLRLEIHAPEFPGLKWTLSKSELKEKEKAVLTVVYQPLDKSKKTPFNLNLVVEPFGGIMAIPVIFASPPATSAPIALPLPKK
ncbi:MAG TPA: hypothetical protein VGK29_23640 [Paludibaculum sp.]|jgi:hypothetical protein